MAVKIKPKKSELDLNLTNYPEINCLYEKMNSPLNSLSDLAYKLERATTKMKKMTGAYLLKDASLDESVQLMLFAYFETTCGDLSKIDLNVSDESPFIVLSKHKLAEFLQPVAECWSFFIETYDNSLTEIKSLEVLIPEFSSEADKIMNKTKEICTAKGLGIADFGNVLKIVTENLKKIHNSETVLITLVETLKNITNIVNNLQSLVKTEEYNYNFLQNKSYRRNVISIKGAVDKFALREKKKYK